MMGYRNGTLMFTALGAPIPDQLATGPDPAQVAPPGGPDELPIDEGMRWMADYEAAAQVGMAIRARLNADQAQGFDFLLVFGIKASPPQAATDGTPDLVRLLDAHHYTNGLSFVLQGTPSNNTADAPSGFSSGDSDTDESYQAEFTGSLFRPDDRSNADVLSTALGFRKQYQGTLARAVHAGAHESLDAGDMNRAVWPATWGYFLREMLPGPLSPEDIEWTRQHFGEYVRAAGPLPAIRIGKQPYGVLPVTSLLWWKPPAGQEQAQSRHIALKNLLITMLGVWRRSVPQAPRLGRGDSSPDRDFADVLSMDGLSSSYGIKHVMGDEYLSQLWTMIRPGDQRYWWSAQRMRMRATLNAAGIPWESRLSRATYSGWSKVLRGPVVQAEAFAKHSPLQPNYLELLLNEWDLETLRNESFAVGPRSLMYAVLRHALLLEYWRTAVALRAFDAAPIGPGSMESEIVLPGAVTPWAHLNTSAAGVTKDPMWDYLRELGDPPADPRIAQRVAPLLALRESLARLKSSSAASLQRLFAGSLDICAYRLDAWITSMATRRLADMRRTRPVGLLIGGYGWVMNLKPGAAPEVERPPEGQTGLFLKAADNPGYTHAASLAQSATVAVLRSGHLTHADSPSGDPLAIDLSSERVRLAKWILDGVRQGQPLGALLGYRFERRLVERRLGQFIPAFRDAAPIVANKIVRPTDPPSPAAETVAATNVVDGLLLHRRWRELLASVPMPDQRLAALFSPIAKPPAAAALAAAAAGLDSELNDLDLAVDALSDALLAETVHHAVNGDPLRTAATVEAIANGEAPPPDLDVVSTPRTGTSLTHRVIVALPASADAPAAWGPPAMAARAQAEPRLNGWAARLLGDPGKVRCVVEQIDRATGAVVASGELRLRDLGLAPLDCLYAASGDRDGQPSELEQRILYAAARQTSAFPADAALRLAPGRQTGWASTDLSFGEFAEMVRAARDLITGSRAFDAGDLVLPEQDPHGGIDLSEIRARTDAAAQALTAASLDLADALEQPTSPNDAIRNAMLRAAHLGLAGSVPASRSGDAEEARTALLEQGRSVAKEVTRRLERLAAVESPTDTTSETDRDAFRRHAARMRAIFGDSFLVLPLVTAANGQELARAAADSERIQGDDDLPVRTWFDRVARVREGVDRLATTLRYAEIVETGDAPNLRVMQLPYQPGDRWIGLPVAEGQALSTSRLSLVVHGPGTLDLTTPMAGLLIDEWIEVVPSASETTGIVFQFDQPNASPPQSILLAVPPDPDQQWTMWSLQQVLLETIDLLRVRAVDAESLSSVGHFLPAAYFAVNVGGDTVSTDFTPLVNREGE